MTDLHLEVIADWRLDMSFVQDDLARLPSKAENFESLAERVGRCFDATIALSLKAKRCVCLFSLQRGHCPEWAIDFKMHQSSSWPLSAAAWLP